MNPLYGAAAALVLAIGSFGAGWHFGRQGLELRDSKAVVKQAVAEDTKRTTDQTTVATEAKTYEAATDPLAPLAAPVVRMCDYTPATAMPSAHPAGSGAHAAAAVPAPAPRDPVPGPDIGRPVVQVGKFADARVVALQDYIQRVCQAKTP
jgi:hypothetical protein